MLFNSPGHFEQSVYQKAFESRRLIKRVTNKKAKPCRNPKNQRRDRNSILMAHWRMCRNAFITYRKARETESVFPRNGAGSGDQIDGAASVVSYIKLAVIVLCSRRSDEHRTETVQWLKKQRVKYHELRLRPDGDRRSDVTAKRKMLYASIKAKFCW